VLRSPYRDKKVVGVFVRFRAPLHPDAQSFRCHKCKEFGFSVGTRE
jgi:hypothetical protein